MSLIEKSQAQIISTFAGNGTGGHLGDGGQATNAEISIDGMGCGKMAVDAVGNIYFADQVNNRIRKVSTSGIINTIAGTGVFGYSGDGGQAIAAQITPGNVCVDALGNVYFDDGGSRIRKINTNGIINTIAGTGVQGYSGDGGPATAAELDISYGMAISPSGNIYIADLYFSRIRIIDTSGIINTVVGNGTAGYSGDGGQAINAEICSTHHRTLGVSVDAVGNLYVIDGSSFVIRKVNTSGIISTVVGTGIAGYSGDGGQATAAQMNGIDDIAFDWLGNMYISDFSSNVIRKVDNSGIITTFVGTGVGGYSGDGGPATGAKINDPSGMTCDASGNLYFFDNINERIRKITVPSCGDCLAISQISSLNTQISVCPNPASTTIQVSWSSNSNYANLVMTDMLGNILKELRIKNAELEIDITDLPAGVYFIILTNDTTRTTQKVVVR